MKRLATWAVALSASALGGCGIYDDVDPRTVGVRGPAPTLEQASITAQDAAQRQLFTSLMERSDLTKADLPIGSPNWQVVTEAGLYEIDRQCDQYLAALYRFNRDQRAARTGLTAAGATTAALLGLTGAAGVTIAITAAAFGLAATLFDASTNSVLFTIEPSAMRSIMLRSRQAYLTGIEWQKVTNRPRMMIVLQGYLQQCTPAAIEANINNAATGAPSVASTNADVALKAAAMAAPSASIMQNPKVWSFTQVSQGGSQQQVQVTVDNRAPNLEPSEDFVKSKDQIIRIQRALGVGTDGDIGKFNPADQSQTRKALAQFQTGLLRENKPDKQTQATALLDPTVYGILSSVGAMPTQFFESPFERGLMSLRGGNFAEPTGAMIEFVIELVDGTPQEAAATTEAKLARLAVMRSAIASFREKNKNTANFPAALGKPTAMDSALFDFAFKAKNT